VSHYFTDNRNLAENRKVHSFRFSGYSFTFTTDNGVFAKAGVDYGTEVLLECAANENLHGALLDLGCGYGVIGIVLKRLCDDLDVVCCDINPRAIELTEINCVSNAVSCAAVESDGFQAIQGEFNFIITNPPVRAGKQVIYKMFEDAKDRLCEGGVLLAVIRRKQGAESALRKLQEVFGNCETVARDKGYWVLRSERVDSFEEAC